jgi:NitT/TauT family transport system permease protein
METFKSLFKLGGTISNRLSTIVGVLGFVFLMAVWYIITSATGWVKPQTIPSPNSVLFAFVEMFSKDQFLLMVWKPLLLLIGIIITLYFIPFTKFLVNYAISALLILFAIYLLMGNFIMKDAPISMNILYSLQLNVAGYLKAILISIPIGFLIALFPLLRSMFSKYIDAIRYVPLTGLIGVFIAWFGIASGMKINFLAFGIIVYLLPIVVQRVYETEKIHLDTIFTLGANSWQTFRKIYWPSVISKLITDIRVITAISWTYIIVAEMANNEGGLGGFVYTCARQSRLDKIFAVILIIVIIGFLQDILFKWLDKKINKFKYV